MHLTRQGILLIQQILNFIIIIIQKNCDATTAREPGERSESELGICRHRYWKKREQRAQNLLL